MTKEEEILNCLLDKIILLEEQLEEKDRIITRMEHEQQELFSLINDIGGRVGV